MSTKTKAKLETLNTGLAEESRASVVEALNGLLSDLFVVYTKARNYHWNVEGDRFFALHAEFEKLYTSLATDVDEVAERVRALGGVAYGTMAQFLEHSSLKEASKLPDAKGMVADLLSDYESLVAKLRELAKKAEAAEDAGTEDFLIGLMEGYEKTAWMLRAFSA